MARIPDVLVGGIEAGGTKFVCAVGTGPGDRMLARASFPTGDRPAELLATVAGWLQEQEGRHGRLRALGIASFGPVDLRPGSPTYGFITSTPKPGWQDTDVVGRLRAAFGDIPIGFDTDVNGAALGEHAWGNAAGLSDFVYITLGTGIGAGAMVGGELLHGLVHPEMGHMLLPRAPGDDFPGVCPYPRRLLGGALLRTGHPPPDRHARGGPAAGSSGLGLGDSLYRGSHRQHHLRPVPSAGDPRWRPRKGRTAGPGSVFPAGPG